VTGSSSAAPGRLEVLRRFVNTLDVEASVEALATPGDLRSWLQEAELLDAHAGVGEPDLRHALALREALRTMLAANHDGSPVDAGAVSVVNEAAERARLQLVLRPDASWAAQPRAGGVDAALGELLALVAAASADGGWRRLKVCVNDSCRWAFYDASRARSGRWCSMQVCGNRAKQQAWRTRHEDRGAPPAFPGGAPPPRGADL